MSLNYRITKKADKDLEDIFQYYEEKQQGLGKRFVQNAFQKIDRIVKKPGSYSEDKDNIRKAKVKDFKYYIYYTIKSPVVLIIAVWHVARRPFDRQKRLNSE